MTRPLALVLATAVAAMATATGALAAGQKPKVLFAQANGDIKTLTISRITVDKLTCFVRPGTTSIGRFVVSDPVAIGCTKGVLTSIRYRPLHDSGIYRTGSAPSVSPASAPRLSVTGNSAVMSFGIVTSSGGTTSSSAVANSSKGVSASGTTTAPDGTMTSWTTTNASGTITALDASSITVGGMTCSLQPFPASLPLPPSLANFMYDRISQVWHVGDSASVGCYGGVLKVIGRAGS